VENNSFWRSHSYLVGAFTEILCKKQLSLKTIDKLRNNHKNKLNLVHENL